MVIKIKHMKNIFQLLLSFWFCTTFGQTPDTTKPMRQLYKKWTSGGPALTILPGVNGDYDTLSMYIRMRPRYDTIRAELLVTFTSRRWGVAHARPGYVVKRGGEVVGYLNDRKKMWPPQVTVWRWVRKGVKEN